MGLASDPLIKRLARAELLHPRGYVISAHQWSSSHTDTRDPNKLDAKYRIPEGTTTALRVLVPIQLGQSVAMSMYETIHHRSLPSQT